MTTTEPTPTTDAAPESVSGAEIVFDRVTKSYSSQGRPAVDSLSLTIPAGQIVMFVGPSGCGKTTSLKMINRLHEPTSGTITINGKDVRGQDPDDLRRQVGYVIQGGSLFPHMTVAQNIGLVPGLLRWDKQRIAERVEELLDLVGLDPVRYRDRFPRELSGGQQQRVGVARGLAADPPVILMDEPFGAVDPITRQRLQDELMSIQSELKKTIVCVTHDIDEAIKLGDRILILQEHAQIAQYDTPEAILSAPANEFVEDFVGSGSALKALSLTRVEEVELTEWTTATVGEPVGPVLERARAARQKSVVVLDQRRRPVDWVNIKALTGETVPAPVDEARDLHQIDHRATLNDALDTMLVSAYAGVIVTGRRDQYVGVATFEAVTALITARNEAARQAQEDADEQ
ncbi:ATP-binding cassette domain-containing protein [Desertihabitans brevis]|uniref:ABC-type quaternary amine transporter n=1 Tax=Desertihabitans brevis TaxID=2268447 RepID=A0A367YQS8_9ACTN|nr:ABC transporter ATP-binding protein [Desertihabitans brevis]RCK68246.1 ATP-binding cassette domain-containing protein [Desertihabitans brevis]